MKRLRLLFIVCCIAVNVSAGIEPIEDLVLTEQDEYIFDKDLFGQILTDSMQDAKGFACVVTKSGQVVTSVSDGVAQLDGENPELKFTPNTYTYIGSVSKVITGIALLQVLDAKGISAQAPILDYLPKLWRKEVITKVSNTAQVTFHQLLNHTSGYTDKYNGSVKPYIIEGVDSELIGKQGYANPNYTIIGVLLGIVNADPFILDKDNMMANQVSDGEITLEEYDTQIQEYLAEYYESYIIDHIFNPLGIKASCDITEFSNGNYALMYKSKDDMEPGEQNGDLTYDHGCAVGGLAISMKQLAKIIAYFQYTENLVDISVRDDIFENKYIFNSSTMANYGHNGAIAPGGRCYTLTKGQYQFAIATNTGSIDVKVMKSRVINAFFKANQPAKCEGLTQQAYINKITIGGNSFKSGNNQGYFNRKWWYIDSIKQNFEKETVSISLEPGYLYEENIPLNWAVYIDYNDDGVYDSKLFEAEGVIGTAQGNIFLENNTEMDKPSIRIVCDVSPIDIGKSCEGEVEDFGLFQMNPHQMIQTTFDATNIHIIGGTINDTYNGIDWNENMDNKIKLLGYYVCQVQQENNFYFTVDYEGNEEIYWKLFIDYNDNFDLHMYEHVSSGQGQDFMGSFVPPQHTQLDLVSGFLVVKEGSQVPNDLSEVDLGSAHVVELKFIFKGLDADVKKPPINLIASDITSTGANLSWEDPHAYYPISFKFFIEEKDGVWEDEMTVGDNQKVLHSLKPATTYKWQLKPLTESENFYQYSRIVEFTTLSAYNCGTDQYDEYPNKPNNTNDMATPLHIGAPMYGLICEPEYDWYTFDVTNLPMSYEMILKGKDKETLGGNYFMLLMHEEQGFIDFSFGVDNQPLQLNKALSQGKYYIAIGANTIDSKSEYYKLLVQQPFQFDPEDNEAKVYPNPSKLGENISVTLSENTKSMPYMLYDQYGIKVQEGMSDGNKILLNGIQNIGLYYLSVNGVMTRIIVE